MCGYSAVAYFFAKKLHGELEIPIGIIKTAWGGKPVETFTSREALNTLPGTKKLVDDALAADADYDPEQAQNFYEKRLPVRKSRKSNVVGLRENRHLRSAHSILRASPACFLIQ